MKNNNNKQKTVTLSEIKTGSFFTDGWKYNNEYNITPEDTTMKYSKNDPKPEPMSIQLVGREN